MQCIKTGCDVFLMSHGEFVHGDAYQTNRGDLMIRIAGRSFKPMGSKRHFTVMEFEHWFDERKTSMAQSSTMLVQQGMFTNHGYEGIPEPELAAT